MMDGTENARRGPGSLPAAGLFMALVYVAATGLPGYAVHLASEAELIPYISDDISLIVRACTVVLMFLAGGFVIRTTRLTSGESGLIFRKGEPFLVHAVMLGATASVIGYAIYAVGYGFWWSGIYGITFITLAKIAVTAAWMAASAFLLFGVMQAYLMRKTSSRIRLIRWDIPLAGVVVLLITMVSGLVAFIQQPLKLSPAVIVSILTGICSGVVTLASSYWFERSRSLAAPAAAFGVYGVFGFVLHDIMLMTFR